MTHHSDAAYSNHSDNSIMGCIDIDDYRCQVYCNDADDDDDGNEDDDVNDNVPGDLNPEVTVDLCAPH